VVHTLGGARTHRFKQQTTVGTRDGNRIVIEIASHFFSQKNWNPQKNRICYRISKL